MTKTRLTRRGKFLVRAFAAGLVLAGAGVVAFQITAKAHTAEECARVRSVVADRELVRQAAESTGGLTTAQRDQLTRERAIDNKALQHCPSATPSPSATPTSTPSSVPSSSAPPSSPPPATGWPDTSNTGPASDVALTNYTGPCLITTAGAFIDAKTINCDLEINANGVTVSRSVVNGNIKGTGSYTVTDSVVSAGGPRQESAIGDGSNTITVIRTEATGGHRGIYCSASCTVRDSFIHGQTPPPAGTDWHFGGIRVGANATLVHNSVVCDVEDNGSGGGCSADMTGYPDFEPIHDNRIEGNLFRASPAGYCAYFGATSGKPYSNDPLNATNIVVLNNTWERGTRASQWNTHICAYWGPATDFAAGRTGNVWSGNKWDDGTALSAP